MTFNVIGIDLPDEQNFWKIMRANMGKPPVLSTDENMNHVYKNAYENRNMMATYSTYAFSKADIVVIDINLDVKKRYVGNPYDYIFTYENFKSAIKTVADNISENTLVVIESTVPPGTTQKVIYPIFLESFRNRGLDINKLYLSYSYERVMPGPSYLSSIINFYRVYSGINKESKLKAKAFFESFINTKDYPLFELHSTTAAEMAKVLENSYRAMNIAFIQEWTEYAEKAHVNLFEVIEAIRVRPTHKNIMLPGFGVGGYCLTKDPLLANWSYQNLYNCDGTLKMSIDAVAVNDLMPDYTYSLLKQEVGVLKDKFITILGISYLGDVADTRHTPTDLFYDRCMREGAIVKLHDPLVGFWQERGLKVETDIKSLGDSRHDIAVFATRHKQYLTMSADDILSILPGVKVILDANNIINDDVAEKLSSNGIKMIGVGKGHWNSLRRNDG
ncbi:nucleotide sugar dehydrogenase [Dissulfurispira sp.]|uniref:nucleotide sugar dehydrogenase n=1 Tax=Dissulfurispira sp. TaxID=2817609 RepID=UPI002FD8C92E